MDINYCDICENMTSLHCDKENKLVHFCGVCGESKNIIDKNRCIYKTTFEDYDNCEKLNKNKYLANDITLPTIQNKNILCPNEDCDKKGKIIYIKYDYDKIKYIYICTTCGQKWTN